jgi:hypothetical protein
LGSKAAFFGGGTFGFCRFARFTCTCGNTYTSGSSPPSQP